MRMRRSAYPHWLTEVVVPEGAITDAIRALHPKELSDILRMVPGWVYHSHRFIGPNRISGVACDQGDVLATQGRWKPGRVPADRLDATSRLLEGIETVLRRGSPCARIEASTAQPAHRGCVPQKA